MNLIYEKLIDEHEKSGIHWIKDCEIILRLCENRAEEDVLKAIYSYEDFLDTQRNEL
jgi:uncharacterized protein YlaN (UPF0358 family)